MHLLHARTVRLESFAKKRHVPPYAILSHTWSRGEVTFQDMQGPDAESGSKEGFAKIIMACQEAIFDGLEHVWIDTCCVDRSNDAEVSEALCSAFRWLENAVVCYAYLEDVPPPNTKDLRPTAPFGGRSRWFSRGWTLSELVAPREVRFYAREWTPLGTRTNLAAELARVTGIPAGVFLTRQFRHLSVAERMSWAADRSTTREEDVAYCLIGLFAVRMAPEYGEGGEEAFRRLQVEIMQKTKDESIFAWKEQDDKCDGSVLAKSPACFRGCGGIVAWRAPYPRSVQPFGLADSGIWIYLPRRKLGGQLYGLLQCRLRRGNDGDRAVMAIPLLRLSADSYCRVPGPVLQTRLTKWTRLRAGFVYLQCD